MALLTTLATLSLLTVSSAAPSPARPPEVGVPFACGQTFQVSQAHDTGSHLQYDTWAWDFRMPVGTPIVAAHDGVVRMARGDSTVGGCDMKYAKDANYVVIDHGDGYESQYLHFSSVVVHAGEKVKEGQLIGYSGETGWACGAHLHFKVAKHENDGWNNPSVPAVIEGYGDPQFATLVSAPVCPVKKPEIIQAKAEPQDGAQDPTRTAHGASQAPDAPTAGAQTVTAAADLSDRVEATPASTGRAAPKPHSGLKLPPVLGTAGARH